MNAQANSRRPRHRGFAAVLLLVLVGIARPPLAEEPNPRLARAVARFEAADYEQAIDTLNVLLGQAALGSLAERSQARKYLGLAYTLLPQREPEAVAAFRQLVKEDPGFNLDDLVLKDGASLPEANRYFGQAVVEVRQEEIRAREAQLRRTSRSSALLRSTVLPGWGQRYQGYRRRGATMLSLAVTALGWVATTQRAYQQAQDAYNHAPAGSDFDGLFKEWTRKADEADLALGTAAAVWVVNMLDAATQGPDVPRGQPQRVAMQLRGPSGRGGWQLVCLQRF